MDIIANIILTTLKIIPRCLTNCLGTIVGYIAFLIPSKENKITELHLKKLLKVASTKTIKRNIYFNLGRNISDMFHLKSILYSTKITYSDNNILESLTNRNRPIIILSAHTGNWELLAASLAKEANGLIALGKPLKNTFLQTLLDKIRLSCGTKTLWRNNSKDSKTLIKSLKNNCIIGALLDQDTKLKSLHSNFFDLPCSTPYSIINMSKKYNARFVSTFIFRTNKNNYKIFIKEIDSQLDTNKILDEYHTNLENKIREYPEQWVWFHKRWRTQPNEKTMSSEEYINFLENL